MATAYTRAFAAQAQRLNFNPALMAARFDAWKVQGPDSSFDFGRDGAYVAPKVDGKPYQLHHVHLVPEHDPKAFSNWETCWRKRWSPHRRSSDRVLVYASDPRHGHLLIAILEEPGAHEVARMLNAADAELMKRFASVAAAFMHDGTIDA